MNPSDTTNHTRIAVVGGGPAGLRAAEAAAAQGVQVTLFDGKPSVGRKFLVAGKGGLNLTNAEPLEGFANRYSGPGQPPGTWRDLLTAFDAASLRAWATGLGVDTFEAKSGRVYLSDLKAAPLLRRWVLRLRTLGVQFAMNRRLVSLSPLSPFDLVFCDGSTATADAVILALGGGSWERTGSDGKWMRFFEEHHIATHTLAPANCGWEHDWPPAVLARAEGKPLKNIRVQAAGKSVAGELLLTRYGLEGGPMYALGAILRSMAEPQIAIDFQPAHTHARLMTKMESVRRNFADEARTRWKLSEAAHAILSRREWTGAAELACEAKHCVIPLKGPRPLDEAISSAGGVCWSEIDSTLMVKKIPGLFVAGEMIDWEAPTGGYLLQGCMATGTRAAQAAAAWLASR